MTLVRQGQEALTGLEYCVTTIGAGDAQSERWGQLSKKAAQAVYFT